MKYRSKVVEIDAIQWKGGKYTCLEEFLGRNWGRADAQDVPWPFPEDKEEVVIWNQLEKTWIPCPVGHYIIRGLEGEFYPCAPSVFERKYELGEVPTKPVVYNVIDRPVMVVTKWTEDPAGGPAVPRQTISIPPGEGAELWLLGLSLEKPRGSA